MSDQISLQEAEGKVAPIHEGPDRDMALEDPSLSGSADPEPAWMTLFAE
jgi:hypothetical protein